MKNIPHVGDTDDTSFLEELETTHGKRIHKELEDFLLEVFSKIKKERTVDLDRTVLHQKSNGLYDFLIKVYNKNFE